MYRPLMTQYMSVYPSQQGTKREIKLTMWTTSDVCDLLNTLRENLKGDEFVKV